MGSISCHIMPLVINSLRGRHTYTNTHTDVCTETILRNQGHAGLWPACTWFKNTNTYKALVRILLSGVITFISKQYAGSISDKELTRNSGMLDLLEPGDSVMADRGFDIQDDVALLGVRLNIPLFLKGKSQITEKELVETRWIASIRIHVECAMECIKNFTFLTRLYHLQCHQ